MSVVLVYHSVTGDVEHPWLEVRPRTFAAQLDMVEALGYQWVPVRDAVRQPEARVAALTFDDGLADFLDVVDIVRGRSVPVTQYVCPGMVGTSSRWMSSARHRQRPLLAAGALRELVEAGVEMGCHGWTHTPFPDRSLADLAEDLRRCARWFADELGQPARSLAYPYGRCDERRARLVGETYELALAVEALDGLPPRLAVPRFCVAEAMGSDALAAGLLRYDLATVFSAEA